MKPASNFALCATRILPLIKSKNFGRTVSIFSASFTISFVIAVSSVISFGISLSGFTKYENLSITLLFFIFTAPISIILSVKGSKPVVSISNTTYSAVSMFLLLAFSTTGFSSSTI